MGNVRSSVYISEAAIQVVKVCTMMVKFETNGYKVDPITKKRWSHSYISFELDSATTCHFL